MKEHKENLDKLIELDNIENILDAGSGKTSLTYLINKYPKANIDAIVYPGDTRKIDSIKENVVGKYNLLELDICKANIEKPYDLVLAHLLLGEATKFNNDFKYLVDKLLKINSKYFIIYDFEEDTDIDFEYIKQAVKDNDLEIIDMDKNKKIKNKNLITLSGKTM